MPSAVDGSTAATQTRPRQNSSCVRATRPSWSSIAITFCARGTRTPARWRWTWTRTFGLVQDSGLKPGVVASEDVRGQLVIDVVGIPPQLLEVTVHAHPGLLTIGLGKLIRRRALFRCRPQQHFGPRAARRHGKQ